MTWVGPLKKKLLVFEAISDLKKIPHCIFYLGIKASAWIKTHKKACIKTHMHVCICKHNVYTQIMFCSYKIFKEITHLEFRKSYTYCNNIWLTLGLKNFFIPFSESLAA
jgi:uncharacterized membrane protein